MQALSLSNPVHLRRPKAKLEHRVASLMLCFTAEGREYRCKPAICLPLIPSTIGGITDPSKPSSRKTQVEIASLQEQFPDIFIYVQRNGYFDGVTCLKWLADTMDNFRKSSDHLLVMDNLGAHTNPDFRRLAWEHDPRVWLLYTPPDCTDACAVTDDGLGRTFKNKMRKSFHAHFDANMERWQSGGKEGFSASARRKLYCQWLSEANKFFYGYTNDKGGLESGHTIVRKAFERCGLANSITGADNNLIRISGWNDDIPL